MTRMTAEKVNWVAVLDGAKALLFENKGFADAPDLHLIDKEETAPLAERDLRTDAPGVNAAPRGGPGSAMEEADLQDLAERDFVTEFAQTLNRAALKGKFDRLVVMAPPRALGALRGALHDETTRRVVKELTGDYVNHPTAKLEDILKRALGLPETVAG